MAVSLDEDQLDTDIADLNAKLATGIRDRAIALGLDQGAVDAAIAEIQAKLQAIRDQNAGVGINQGDLDTEIAGIQAKLTALGAEKVDIRVGASGLPETTAELGGVAAAMKAVQDNAGPLADAITGVTSLSEAVDANGVSARDVLADWAAADTGLKSLRESALASAQTYLQLSSASSRAVNGLTLALSDAATLASSLPLPEVRAFDTAMGQLASQVKSGQMSMEDFRAAAIAMAEDAGIDLLEIQDAFRSFDQSIANSLRSAQVSEEVISQWRGLGQQVRETGDQSTTAAAGLQAAGKAASDAGQQAHSAGGWWGALTKEVTLFGGALGDIHMVGTIPLWHILLDAVLETTIAFTEAAVALTALGFAAAPAVEDIFHHIQSVDDVVKTLGIDIPPVTGHLHDLGRALAPQVVELYGGALNTLSSNGSVLAGIVTKITSGFDDWMARLDLFMDKQSHADGLIAAGGDVLQQMSVILDNLGVSLENLVKADPGTVHFLGDLLEGASDLVRVFTEIPAPILKTALAVHAFLLWGGLVADVAVKAVSPLYSLALAIGGVNRATGALATVDEGAGGFTRLGAMGADLSAVFTNLTMRIGLFSSRLTAVGPAVAATGTDMAGVGAELAALDPELAAVGTEIAAIGTEMTATGAKIGAVGTEMRAGLLTTLSDLAVNPLTWIGVAAAGLAAFTVAALLSKDATEQWIDTLNQGLGKDTWFNTLPNNMAAITAVNARLATTQKQLGSAMTGSQGAISGVALRYSGYSEAAQVAQGQARGLSQSVQQLTAEQSKLGTTQQAQIGFLSALGKSYGTTLLQSMGLATVAGVNLAQVTKEGSAAYKAAVQEVANLETGYKDMSVQGNLLATSVNAVSFSTEQQDSKVTDLTQAWTAFISMVTGGESAFDTFETQVAGLGTAADDVSSIGVSAGKASLSIKATGATAAKTRAQIDQLSASGLQLNETFGQGITDANSMMNALLMQASAAGLGAKGTRMLTQAGKDLVAQLLPTAEGSSEATAQLYALAQQAATRARTRSSPWSPGWVRPAMPSRTSRASPRS